MHDHAPQTSYPDENDPATVDMRPVGEWSYTRPIGEIVELRQQHERKNGAKERPTISRDSRIDTGVYEGKYGGEAIVVDREKYPIGFQEAMTKVLAAITRRDGSVDKSMILGSVFDTVSEKMRYDKAAVDDILQRSGGADGTKIALDTYIAEGVGVCRHQALFAGQLLESLKDMGFVSGNVSVDRNALKRDNDDGYDGHAWARYVNSAGDVYVLDPAQGVIDRLDDLMAKRAGGDLRIWDYGRPEDHQRLFGSRAMSAIRALDGQKDWKKEYQEKGGELDENGLIKLPSWVKKDSAQDRSGSHHVREIPVRTPEEIIHSLTADLSADDVSALFRYSLYLSEKARAQKAGDGHGSMLQGQYAGEELRKMSQQARDVASRYHDFRSRL